METQNFFTRYNIDPLAYDRSGCKWQDLENIAQDLKSRREELDSVGKDIVDHILKCGHVHSINYRVKNDEHLIEKIIRKTINVPDRKITIRNYCVEITDLVGIRVLHLFKEDWIHIHSFMTENWILAE